MNSTIVIYSGESARVEARINKAQGALRPDGHKAYAYANLVHDNGGGGTGVTYTGDENLPDYVDGLPNPAKNILVNNTNHTISANLLTAAQTAALLN